MPESPRRRDRRQSSQPGCARAAVNAAIIALWGCAAAVWLLKSLLGGFQGWHLLLYAALLPLVAAATLVLYLKMDFETGGELFFLTIHPLYLFAILAVPTVVVIAFL